MRLYRLNACTLRGRFLDFHHHGTSLKPHLVRARADHDAVRRQRTSLGSLATICLISEKIVRQSKVAQGHGPGILDEHGVLDALPGVANTVVVFINPRLSDDTDNFGEKTVVWMTSPNGSNGLHLWP